MKKIILSAAAMLVFGMASAQIKTNAGTFGKPVNGTTIVEAVMTPSIAGGSIFSLPTLNKGLDMPGVRVRKFSGDKTAMRYTANLSVVNSGDKNAAGDKTPTEFGIGVGVGMENHFAGAERLSTYWGYEGNLGYSAKNDGTINSTDSQIKKFGIGASVFTGFDYYIMPKIYLGAEVSYGLGITNSKAGSAGDSVTKIELMPSITPSFRMGWQF